MADRTLLVERFLTLQTKAAKLGIHGAHITTDMTDDEIIRRGVALAERIKAAEQAIADERADRQADLRGVRR